MSPRRQGVGGAPAVGGGHVVSPHHPRDGRGRRHLGEPGQVQQGVERGVAAADHGHRAARVALARRPEHVRDPVEDVRATRRLSDRGQAVGPQGIGHRVGARGIDHGPGEHAVLAARGADPHLEGGVRAIARLHLVVGRPGDRGDSCAEPDVGLQIRQLGQRLQIPGHELGPGGQRLRIRLRPSGILQPLPGEGIHVVPPRREHLDMAPRLEVRADRRAGFQHEEPLAAGGQMDRGGQSDGTGADHDHGQLSATLHRSPLAKTWVCGTFR